MGERGTLIIQPVQEGAEKRRRRCSATAWTFITPILDAWDGDKSAIPIYQPGSEGPEAADELLARDGRKWGGLHG